MDSSIDSLLKVKISGSLRNPRRTSPSKPRPGYLSFSPQKNRSKCTYIRKLSCAEDREKEIQSVISKIKARMELNYGNLIEDGIKSPVGQGRSPGRSLLRKKTDKLNEGTFDLELPSRFDLTMEQMSTNEPHLLRYVSIALCERIKVMRTQAEEYEAIYEVLTSFEDPMKDLGSSLEETKEQLQREDRKLDNLYEKIENENAEIDEKTRIVEEKIKNTLNDIQNVTQLYEDLRVKNEEFVEDENKEVSIEIKNLNEELSKIEEERENLLEQTELVLKGYDDNQLDLDRAKVLDEKYQYLAQLQSKNSIYDHIVIENLQLSGEIALLSAQVLAEEDAKARMSEIESHKETFSVASEGLKEDLNILNSQKYISIIHP